VNGTEYKYKTYQGQEISKELGYNMLEFKYRHYDPAIARFVTIDPLATEYVYNSTYAFQENKLGLGIELEGAELLKRMKDGIKQFFTGTNNLVKNETFGKAQRQMTVSQTTDGQKIEQVQQEGLSNRTQALGDMGEGAIEAIKGSAQVVGTSLEVVGDGVTAVGIATALPPVIAAGETIGGVGTGINVTVDLSDGKPLDQIALERGPSMVIGKLGGAATKAIRKSAGEQAVKNGETVISETIIKGHEKVYEKISNKAIESQSQPIKYEKKD
jgi:RHS repeat-associated protein